MAEPRSTSFDVDSLVGELRARVEERRREGLYPPNLEEELDGHFRRIVSHRVAPDLDELRGLLHVLEGRVFTPERIAYESRVPGGDAVHKVVSKVVARQTNGILEQMQEFADAVREVLRMVIDTLANPHGHVHADLVGQVDAILEQLAAYGRAPSEGTAAVGNLRLRIEALEEAERRRSFRPIFDQEKFEAAFRGSREEMLDRYRDLAAELAGRGPVLDIGCGRGELLELLAALGVEARGVELDPSLAHDAQQRGFDVVFGDGVELLLSLDDESLGGIALMQVVEHLTPQRLMELVVAAYDKLRPGGRLVMETVNPQSLYVYAHSFYLDPTHAQPVHPAYLGFLCDTVGFSEVKFDWRSPPPDDDVLEPVADGDGVAKKNVERLNQLLFAPQDYAIIATR